MSKFNDNYFNESICKKSNKYFTFKRYKDDDNVTIVTNNIIQLGEYGEYYVLLVGEGKGVWLKDWQVKECRVGQQTYLPAFTVKLSRQYFTVKDITSPKCNDFFFEKEETFDDMVELAKIQDERNEAISISQTT